MAITINDSSAVGWSKQVDTSNGRAILVKVCYISGRKYCDIRYWQVFTPSDEPRPSKKGICVRSEAIPMIIQALQEFVASESAKVEKSI